ncbi:MAG TPA: glycosyltransferase [Thermoanaerobaculia bacterium]|jgi:spore maturation protein CgeB|nr:glycosyltransferase [Thermoanaerobaculia bacterium]
MSPLDIVLFCHSLESDWNHGNAHFLRGVCRALQERGHRVTAYEPRDGWSRTHLLAERGGEAEIRGFHCVYPDLESHLYDLETLDLDRALDGADLVLVHEWNPPELVRRLGEYRKHQGGYSLLFHDTHHRSASEPASLAAYDLEGYDGVLAFGAAVREKYLKRGWADRVWVWHEAADATVFKPLPAITHDRHDRDIVWIGNWGDDERTAELQEFFLEPVRDLKLRADAYGVRYPAEALEALLAAGVRYRGWLPNFRVPEEFARHRFTIHVPRRPYVEALPGIPTIRVFEALACGIPLITAPWRDSEGLFQAGRDYLVARDSEEMRHAMRALMEDPDLSAELASHGRATILARHTCGHRVNELLAIHDELAAPAALQEAAV